jgi:hypothetical protein
MASLSRQSQGASGATWVALPLHPRQSAAAWLSGPVLDEQQHVAHASLRPRQHACRPQSGVPQRCQPATQSYMRQLSTCKHAVRAGDTSRHLGESARRPPCAWKAKTTPLRKFEQEIIIDISLPSG